jgi:hypothetical protein
MKKTASIMLLLAVLSLNLTGCATVDDVKNSESDASKNEEISSSIIPTVLAGTFAEWREDEISYTASVDPYTVEIPSENPMEGNVTIYEGQYVSPEAVELLNKNAFVIDHSYNYDEYFNIYEENRYEEQANFVTTDSALHTYHLFFNYLLKSLEENELYDVAFNLSQKMTEESAKQYELLKGTALEAAAIRNLAYFSVAEKILNKDAEINPAVKDLVENELKLIEAHKGIAESGILGTEGEPYKEDYSQYIPRGHYTSSEKLKTYFNAVMWYGRMTFRLSNEDETKSALLVVAILNENEDLLKNWEKIYEPINFFVGEPDDLSFYEYISAAGEVYGDLTVDKLKEAEAKLAEFLAVAENLRPPKINSMPIFAKDEDREGEIKGFRFLGQRSTVDAMIFQKLIYRDVLENSNGDQRMLPKGLDIAATFGSDQAYEILDAEGDTDYKNYKENMQKLKAFLTEMPQENWGSNLYWGWMNALRTFTKKYGEGYPSFMTNDAWKKKELVTFLGSWTELKHDTILYAKQVYAELGGGPGFEKKDDRGYVEPNPELYNRMKSLTQLTIDGLDNREILSGQNKEQLEKLVEMFEILREISIKELENETLTDDEYEFIRSYGGSLEHFWSETLSAEDKAKDKKEFLNSHPAAIVADVATDPNGTVLEEGVGSIKKIMVVFPIDGELHLGTGGVFSHYEFPWPMEDRLTDEKWRGILYPYDSEPYEIGEFNPEIAPWQREFTLTYY